MVLPRLATTLTLVAAAGLVTLWVLLATVGPGVGPTGRTPVPESALPPIFLGVAIYSALALAAAGAALRRAPLVVLLCGAISLVPVGLYTLFLPMPFRLIGVLDITLVACGGVLLRNDESDVTTAPETSSGADTSRS